MRTLFCSGGWRSGVGPAAATANVAVCPAVTVWLPGCVVIVGTTGAGFTVSVAAELVTVPTVFVSATPNSDLQSPVHVACVLLFEENAPEIATPFFRH